MSPAKKKTPPRAPAATTSKRAQPRARPSAPPPPKRDGRSERADALRESRRAQIVEAAIRTFGQHGYHATGIDQIVEAAGVARGTFYLYFESKNAVFLELLDELVRHLRANVVGVETDPGSPPLAAQLHETVRRVLWTLVTNRHLTAILFREAIGLDEEVDARLSAFYNGLHAYLCVALQTGQQLGLIRDPVDVEVVSWCILGSIKELVDQDLLAGNGRALDVDRVARAIVSYNLDGLARR